MDEERSRKTSRESKKVLNRSFADLGRKSKGPLHRGLSRHPANGTAPRCLPEVAFRVLAFRSGARSWAEQPWLWRVTVVRMKEV